MYYEVYKEKDYNGTNTFLKKSYVKTAEIV